MTILCVWRRTWTSRSFGRNQILRCTCNCTSLLLFISIIPAILRLLCCYASTKLITVSLTKAVALTSALLKSVHHIIIIITYIPPGRWMDDVSRTWLQLLLYVCVDAEMMSLTTDACALAATYTITRRSIKTLRCCYSVSRHWCHHVVNELTLKKTTTTVVSIMIVNYQTRHAPFWVTTDRYDNLHFCFSLHFTLSKQTCLWI